MKVFIVSPLHGNIEDNIRNLKTYCKQVFNEGNISVCSHWYALGILDDDVPSDREKGIKAGLELLESCDMVYVYGNPTNGMLVEIDFAWKILKPWIFKT